MKKILFFIFLIFLVYPSFSQPQIFDEIPQNGSYIYGRDTDIFSIKAISSSSVSGYLYVRVKDPTSVWKEIYMNCFQEENWICTTTIPGLEALLAEGKYLLYYFKVLDLQGVSFYGNESFPLEVLVDRSPPLINLAFPYSNLTYVSERKKLSFIINDTLSGVNKEKVEVLFSYGNETWNSSWIKMIFDNQTNTFIAPWNSSLLPNNSSWIVYVNASDNIGNYNVTKIGVFYVDNEEPRIIDYRPKNYEGIWGGAEVYVKGEDSYSGLNRLEISILDFFDYVYCSKNECRYILDTLKFSDGNYTLNLTLYDNAENFVTVLVPVKIDNTYPVLSLEYKSEYLSKIANFTLRVGNVKEIRNARLKISTINWQSENELNCINFTCNFLIDTRSYPDGKYTFTFFITNEVGYVATYSKEFVFDNTLPTVMASEPTYENNTVKLYVGIFDENGINVNLTKIEAFGEIFFPRCRILTGGKRVLCEIEILKNTLEENYSVIFYGYDLAGNENKDEKILSKKEINGYLEENLGRSFEELNKTKTHPNLILQKIIEFLKRGIVFFVFLFIIFFTVLIFKFIVKPVVFSFNLTSSIKRDLDSLIMVERYLTMRGETILEEKSYLVYARKILDDIPEISSLIKNYEKVLKIAPRILKQKLIEEFSDKIKKMKKRENLINLKVELDNITELSDINEIEKEKKRLIEIFKKCRSEIEEEIKIASEIEKYLGG